MEAHDATTVAVMRKCFKWSGAVLAVATVMVGSAKKCGAIAELHR